LGKNATHTYQYFPQYTDKDGLCSGFTDVNGDGLVDRVHQYNYSTREYGYWVQLNTGLGFGSFENWGSNATNANQYRPSWSGSEGTYSSFVDINGDGLVDKVHHYNYKTREYGYWIQLNTGKRFGDLQEWGSKNASDNRQYTPSWSGRQGTYSSFLDVNGDGLVDRIHHYNYSTKRNGYWVQFNSGSKFGDLKAWVSKGLDKNEQYIPAWNESDNSYSSFVDINGDGLVDKLHHHNYDPHNKGYGHWVQLNQAKVSYNLTSITDSFGNKTTINYKSLMDSSVYKKYKDGKYPNNDVVFPMQVVSSVTVPSSTSSTSTTSYFYEGLKVNKKGLGSLGFAKITVRNDLAKSKTETYYRQDFPYNGSVKASYSYIDGTLASKNQLDYAYDYDYSKKSYFIKNTKQVTSSYLGNRQTNTVENLEYDSYGNIKKMRTTLQDHDSGDTLVQTTSNTYTNNKDRWILGRLTKSSVNHYARGNSIYKGSSSITKESSFTYDYYTGILLSETIGNTNSSKWIKKIYQYDDKGNKIKETISGKDIKSSTTTTTYDSDKRLPIEIKNSLGHQQKSEYDREGNIVKVTDPNGYWSHTQYDRFGKKIRQSNKDNTYSAYSYAFDSSVRDSYYKISVDNGITKKTTYYNRLDQAIQSQTIGFDGKTIYQDLYYDKYGNTYKKSTPYTQGETPHYTLTQYDSYQRPYKITKPDIDGYKNVSSISYSNSGYVTETNAKNQKKTTYKNALGKTYKVNDKGQTLHYKYNAVGNLIQTIDSANNKITLSYDNFGNKTSQNDPDMGYWSYQYNSLGQLISQTDAKKQTTKMEYDLLGRKTKEILSTKENKKETSYWIYDTRRKGSLSSEYKKDSRGKVVYKKEYYYDSYGRLSKTVTNLEGKSFTQSFVYDKHGRVSKKYLPNNFELLYTYNDYGYLESIKSPKAQIKDFDPEHFVNLVDQALHNSLENYKKYTQYQRKADELFSKAEQYKRLAKQYAQHEATFVKLANDAQNYAKQYKATADYYAGEANSYKRSADYYIEVSNRYNTYYKRYRSWIYSYLANYYQRLANTYQNYVQDYTQISNDYLRSAQSYLNDKNAYLNSANYYNRVENDYLAMATKTLQEAKSALQTANYYKNLTKTITQKDKDNAAVYDAIAKDPSHNYFYKVLKQDSFGRITSYMSGNGLITNHVYGKAGELSDITTGYNFDKEIRDLHFDYDADYNVVRRQDQKLGVTQNFVYDSLNRVTFASADSKPWSKAMYYSYDKMGNITKKSDIGSYTYNQSHPHQVTRAGKKTFTYDANGNMITNDGMKIEYTAFNKVSKMITKDKKAITLSYDSNKNRYKKETQEYTAYYVGKSFEKVEHSQGYNENKYYIYANKQVISIYTAIENTNQIQPSTQYLHYDNLGSVDTITDSAGIVVSRAAYKPFGEKYNLDKNGNETDKAQYTNRGYTGHEHIQETHLVNMNGRVYDPTIARFIQADPHIQAPYNSQSYNRYAYVINNPLKYTDPSGYFFSGVSSWVSKGYKKHEKTIISAAIIVAAAYTGGLALSAMGYSSVGAAITAGTVHSIAAVAISGAVTGALSGYGIAKTYGASDSQAWNAARTGARNGAISAFAAYGVAELTGYTFGIDSEAAHSSSFFDPQGGYDVATFKALAHAVTRVAIAREQGENERAAFWSGFAASGFAASSDMGVVKGTAVTAAISGTVSDITGGKFANGAVSGAFIHMFNSVASVLSGQGAKKGTHEVLEDKGVNKSMNNILSQGAAGMISGAVGGFMAGGPIGGLVGAFVGGVFGTAMGLTTGAVFESTGVNDYTEKTMRSVTNYISRRLEDD
jgi:RHS repeat-associated protein